MQKFRHAVEAGDLEALVACLAEGVVFHSPLVFRPYEGRAAVSTILRAVMSVFKDFRYVSEMHAEGESALVFRTRVGDREIEGVDWLRVDEGGLVTHLTVFVRPLSGALALGEAMRAALGVEAGPGDAAPRT